MVPEVLLLQKRIKSMIAKDVTLADVVQVMLIRRALPCQRRPLKMWEFNLEDPWTLQWIYDTTHKGIWKLLFKKQKSWPKSSDDTCLDCNHPASEVNSKASEHQLVRPSEGGVLSSPSRNRSRPRRRGRSGVHLHSPKTRPILY